MGYKIEYICNYLVAVAHKMKLVKNLCLFLSVPCLLTVLLVILFYQNGGYVKNTYTVNSQVNYYDTASYVKVNPLETSRIFNKADDGSIRYNMDILANTSKAPGIYMNRSVDPCEDFYEYSCGNYRHLPDVDVFYPKFSMFTRMDRKITSKVINLLTFYHRNQSMSESASGPPAVYKARQYYHSCLYGHQNREITNNTITELLDWYTDHGFQTLETFLASVHRRGISTLMRTSVQPHPTNSTQHQIVFDIPSSPLTLQKTSAYTGDRNRVRYTQYITAVCNLLNRPGDKHPVLEIVKEKVTEMWTFETQLAKVLHRTKQTGKVNEKLSVTLTNLQQTVDKNFNVINLAKYMKNLVGQKVPQKETVSVLAMDYFQNITRILKNTHKSVLVSYSAWHAILTLSDLPAIKHLLHGARGILAPILGKTSPRPAVPSPQKCAGMAETWLTEAVTWLYLHKYHDPEAFQKFEDIFSDVASSLHDYLDQPTHPWMSRASHHLARLKAQFMQSLLGFPRELMDPETLTQYYRQLNVSTTGQVANQLNVLRWKAMKNLEHYGQPYSRSSWERNPLQCNARYEHLGNRVIFPIALHQEPFFVQNRPMSFNYGSIGFLFAHEMTHGFDKKSWFFNPYGEYSENRLGEINTQQKFNSRIQKCFLNQFSKYKVDGHQMNGELNLNENVADSGGLYLATRAFNTWLLHQPWQQETPVKNQWQQFFLAFAQTWCTTYTKEYTPIAMKYDSHTYAKFRVIGTVSNSKEFAEAYECPLTSPMNPPEKCSMW